MSLFDSALLVTGSIALLVGLFIWALELFSKSLAPRPTLGVRGLKRARALRKRSLFAFVEPSIRYVAARVSGSRFVAMRYRLRRLTVESGDYLGLSEDELLACSVLSGVGAVAVFAVLRFFVDVSAIWAPMFATVGMVFPYLRIRAVARARIHCVTRGLPSVIELAAMCMGAGLDFPSSLRRVMESAPDPDEPIIEEIGRMLTALDLGSTRREALHAFAERVPSDEVRELVNSATQAEDKGSPLARTLTIQAQTLRLRRSVSAEEAASGAALMLVGPTALIFLCVIALLLGPVVVRFMAGGVAAP